MDADMIYYVLSGHTLQNDVQTMIQVFLANRHYTQTEDVTDGEITVKSELKKGIASAMLYRRGDKTSEWSMEYEEASLTEKEQKRIVKRTIYELLRKETGIRPQWGLLTGVRPAKLISVLLEEGKTDGDCMKYLTEDYLVQHIINGFVRICTQHAKQHHDAFADFANHLAVYGNTCFCHSL